MKTIVLGAGLVGGPMAVDLARGTGFTVSVADIDAGILAQLARTAPVNTFCADLSGPDRVASIVQDYDLVLSAVPGRMGFRTLQALIAAGKSVVDIAFFPEDPPGLDEAAKSRGVTAIVDCGVAPDSIRFCWTEGGSHGQETVFPGADHHHAPGGGGSDQAIDSGRRSLSQAAGF